MSNDKQLIDEFSKCDRQVTTYELNLSRIGCISITLQLAWKYIIVWLLYLNSKNKDS